jgi:putative membrane protein
MDEFNEEGIKKITDFLDEDVQDIVDRLEAVRDAGDAYQLFSDSGSDVNGKVKFVIETGSIG